MKTLFIVFIVLFLGGTRNRVDRIDKINGVNYVAPIKKTDAGFTTDVLELNASWIGITPYAYAKGNTPYIKFNVPHQHWGERQEGTITTIVNAKKKDLKVMLKPHVWVSGQGWTGDFSLNTEEEWELWELEYERYILSYCKLADSLDVDLFCIGTEYKVAIEKRSQFWVNLIGKIRMSYKGQLTYAANWDNYKNVTFWDHLDYIGVDAYFPLSENKTPEIYELTTAWQSYYSDLNTFRFKMKKPVLFTEFGYRSIDQTAWKQWELKDDWKYNEEGNLIAQSNAYQAIFQTFWNEPWFAGGFIWKWYDDDSEQGGPNNNDYTPQNKPVEEIIKAWYKKG